MNSGVEWCFKGVNPLIIQNEKINKAKVKKGLIKSENYALALVDGKSKWGRIPFLSDGVNIFSKGTLKLIYRCAPKIISF